MTDDEGFATRFFLASLHLSSVMRRKVTQGELTDLVVAELPAGETLSQTTVGRWLTGSVPDLATIVAIARATKVDPGWLAFGEDSKAPAPPMPGSEKAAPVPKKKGGGRAKGD